MNSFAAHFGARPQSSLYPSLQPPINNGAPGPFTPQYPVMQPNNPQMSPPLNAQQGQPNLNDPNYNAWLARIKASQPQQQGDMQWGS